MNNLKSKSHLTKQKRMNNNLQNKSFIRNGAFTRNRVPSNHAFTGPGRRANCDLEAKAKRDLQLRNNIVIRDWGLKKMTTSRLDQIEGLVWFSREFNMLEVKVIPLRKDTINVS